MNVYHLFLAYVGSFSVVLTLAAAHQELRDRRNRRRPS